MKKGIIISITMLGVLIIAAGVSLCIGSAEISPSAVLSILAGGNQGTPDYMIITGLRLPRIILAIIVGAMLGISGAALQSLFRNSLVDPFITGISSGAALGASIGIISGFTFIIAPAFAGAMLAVFFVYTVSIKDGRVNSSRLLLTGVMTGTMLSSAVMLLSAVNSRDIVKVIYWLMGDLSGSNYQQIKGAAIILLAALAAGMFFANDLNIMSAGEETASTLGVNPEFLKLFYFILASIITAAAVSLSGVIGFIGLVVPHAVRKFTGPDLRFLLPASAVFGALFLLVCDTLARTIFLPGELPVGVITGLIGAPIFIILAKRVK
ncbi:MAG: iron ABC transporter [Candidatus Goldiibacteriota bacterium HGW-Goldbacteria-1]|jgi:iron complex transport system permease protein|nr:MAG: iron ABC transporter [Candidatus Goldiibacteriota bacterium HGW-Goldbacteria-1]